MAQRPSGSISLPGFAVYAETKKTKGSPEPGIGRGSTRHKSSFDLFEPEAGITSPLVELNPRHALAP